MGYEKSKIYKLQCDDGHYYFGSTINILKTRLQQHKGASTKHPYRVYQYINNIGWDKVSIILLEEYPCSNKKELLQKESEYISKNINDPLCLNSNLSFISDTERQEKHRKLNEKYKDKLAEYHKEKRTGNPEVAEYQRQYREQNKEKLKESKSEYYLKNKEERDKKNKERYYANREKILEQKRAKYKTNQIDQT